MTRAELVRPSRKQRVRTLWISDVHLGTRDCQAEHLSQFLKGYQADRIYLVGDIIDGWKLRGGMYWPPGAHQRDPPPADHEQARHRGDLRHRQP